MPGKNIKGFPEYLRRFLIHASKHLLEDNMDLAESIDTAIDDTKQDVVQDIEKEFIAQVSKMIFGK